jgi:phenylalanine-4-hydroxylase
MVKIVLDGQTCNCDQDVIADFAQNAFLLLKTTHFSTCSAIVLITQDNFFDFLA